MGNPQTDVEKVRDSAVADAAAAEKAAADARAAAKDATKPKVDKAANAAVEAAEAQGDVDRLEQKTRAGGAFGLSGDGYNGEPHGLTGDAFGGPTEEEVVRGASRRKPPKGSGRK